MSFAIFAKMVLEVMIKRSGNAKIPSYSYEGDAGVDLYSAEDYVLKPMESKTISTGLKIAIPYGYVGLIWDKSGLAAKHCIHNLAGVIDSGFRGEVKVVMINLGKKGFRITKGMKIAQLLFHKVPKVKFIEIESLEKTDRNENGFGST